MISYRRLAMRVLGYPLRVTALALTAAMVAGMAAPAYAGTYYIGDGDITITKDEKGDVYVKHADTKDKSNGDVDNGDIIIKGGKRSEDTTAPGGSSSEGGTPATSAAKSASATLKVEDSENEDKDMVYPGDTKGGDSSDGSGEENENQSTEKTQTSDTTDGKNTGAGSSDPESKDSEGGTSGSSNGTTGSDGTSGSGGSDIKADDTPTTGGEENDPKPGGTPTPAEGTESTESNRSAPESQFTYTSANNDEGTSNESTTTLKTAAENFKTAAQNVIRIINKLAGNDNTLNVTLDNVNITAKNDAALSVEGAGDTKITLKGDNKLTSGDHHAGLEHNEKSDDSSSSVGTGKLTITSEKEDGKDTGSLTATGDSGAAGIGGAWSKGAGTIEIAGGNITAISPISQSGRNDNDGGAGIGSGAKATGSTNTNIIISGGTIVNAQVGFGGDGIGGGSGSKNITVNIEGGTIETAQGGQGHGSYDGGSGIHSDGDLTISGNAHIVNAIGGNGDSNNSRSDAGDGIRAGTLTISGEARIDNATGGTTDSGSAGDGIYSYGNLTIKDNAKIGTAKGGGATARDKDGGCGIRNHGQFTMSGGTITNAVGGTSTGNYGTGGSGIYSDGKLTIDSATITNATGGTSNNGTGGSGIRGDGNSFKLTIDNATITNATGGSGKWGGTGILGKTMEILTSTILKAIGGRSTGEESYHTGGAGIAGSESLTIEGDTKVQATGGDAESGTGGSGIRSGSSLSISGGTISATGGSGKSGGAGIASSGTVSISDGKIEQATGGTATGEDGTGGSGIRSNGTLTIKGGEIQQTSGGDATGKGGTGGNGIRSDGSVKIWGGTITKATGGSGKSGGDGIGSYGALTISGSAKIETAQGGASTNGNGGSGISSGGILTIEGSANIGTAQGGASTNGTGGDGIHSGSVVKISGDTITKATGGNATGENSTGGSGIVGSFVNVTGGTINTTGGSGKSGGAGIDGDIVSIGNSDTPLDLTATAPDADNAIRGRDGKKLDEIIHLEENGKRGLVKLVENGVTRLFHNGVYTKTALPDFSGSETHPLGEWVTTTKPTCTEPGKKQRSCTVKDCVVTETEELPALGHQWSGWTPVEGGSREYRICAVCNAVEYRDVSHNSGFIIPTNLRVLDSTQTDILQNAQLVRLNQINDVLYIDVALETASLQGVLSDLTGLRSENIETIVFSTERCTSTLSLSDVAALGAGDTPFTLSHSGSTATFTVGGADHSALLR